MSPFCLLLLDIVDSNFKERFSGYKSEKAGWDLWKMRFILFGLFGEPHFVIEKVTFNCLSGDLKKKNRNDSSSVLDGLNSHKNIGKNENSKDGNKQKRKIPHPPVLTDEPTQWKRRSFLALLEDQKENSVIFDALKCRRISKSFFISAFVVF